jgi:hypothetical protein
LQNFLNPFWPLLYDGSSFTPAACAKAAGPQPPQLTSFAGKFFKTLLKKEKIMVIHQAKTNKPPGA